MSRIPAEAPRHDPRCELGNPGIRRTAEPICTCGAASSSVSAARLRNRVQEIQARVDNAIFSKIDPDVPYLLAELKALTDALVSAEAECQTLGHDLDMAMTDVRQLRGGLASAQAENEQMRAVLKTIAFQGYEITRKLAEDVLKKVGAK